LQQKKNAKISQIPNIRFCCSKRLSPSDAGCIVWGRHGTERKHLRSPNGVTRAHPFALYSVHPSYWVGFIVVYWSQSEITKARLALLHSRARLLANQVVVMPFVWDVRIPTFGPLCYKCPFALPLSPSQTSLSPIPHTIMPPYNMNDLVESAQSNLALFSSFVMVGQTVTAMLLFVGAGVVFRLAYHQCAVAAISTEEDDRALLSRPRVRPVSRIAFPVAGVNSGRVYTCSTAAPPRARGLSPLALVSDEGSQKGKDDDDNRAL